MDTRGHEEETKKCFEEAEKTEKNTEKTENKPKKLKIEIPEEKKLVKT